MPPPPDGPGPLRVALLAGGLGQGGAEKQLVYMARALTEAGARVHVYCLTTGEHYETALRQAGIPFTWVGRLSPPPLRLVAFVAALAGFRPHIIQSTHFFANLYAAFAARLYRAVGIGSVRNDVVHELEANGVWGPWLLRRPAGLIANSYAAARTLAELGIAQSAVRVVPNVIDLARFTSQLESNDVAARDRPRTGVVVIGVARLVPQKRLDRFLAALALARRTAPTIRGVLVGDGPERARLVDLAGSLGLLPDAVSFLGRRDDLPSLLRQADIFMLTSAHEGFPNVVLEAMAAGLPVVTTPAGDAPAVVENEATGYVVDSDSAEILAARLIQLAESRDLRCRLGAAGRARVAACYGYDGLAPRLFDVYRHFAEQQRRTRVRELLA